MRRWQEVILYVLVVLIVISGVLFARAFVRAGDNRSALISFGVAAVCLLIFGLAGGGRLRHASVMAGQYSASIEMAEERAREALERVADQLPQVSREDLRKIAALFSLFRTEIAALGVRLTAVEEELAAVRARLPRR